MAKPFMGAISSYFGRQQGQSISDFKKEVDALTDKDRKELAEMLSPIVGETVQWEKAVPANDVAKVAATA